MNRRPHFPMRTGLLMALAIVTALCPYRAADAGRNEDLVKRLNPAQRRQLESLTVLSGPSLHNIATATSPDEMEKRTREILALDNLAVGARQADETGRGPVHRFVHEKMSALPGVEYLGHFGSVVAAPVAVDKLKSSAPESPSRLTVGGKSWPVLPLWPNGAMPSLCPSGGLAGTLLYVGRGEWDDLRGLELAGSIALMDFQGGRNFERLFSLGCEAVIVIEDDHINRETAQRLYCNTPVPFPRFYVDKATGAEMVALAKRKVTGADGATSILPGETCRLEGGNVYENRPVISLFYYLPPTAPVLYQVRDADLLERVAAELGVAADDLIKANNLSSPRLTAGQTLAIPNSTRTYTVRNDDLLERIAGAYGLTIAEIVAANNLTDRSLDGLPLLTIPNFQESLVVLSRLDSASVVPDGPHGAQTAANLAIAMANAEHLAKAGQVVRRKGVIFGFLDGDSLGGVTSRSFAEYVLLGKGELKETVGRERKPNLFPIVAVAVGILVIAAMGGILGFLLRDGSAPDKQARQRRAIGSAIGLVLAATVALYVTHKFTGRTSTAADTGAQTPLERYQATRDWFALPDRQLTTAQAKWLCEQWLRSRIEDRRVQAAEERIELVMALRGKITPAEQRELQAKLHAVEKRLSFLVELRDASIENRALPWKTRPLKFRELLLKAEADQKQEPLPLTFDGLRERIESEYRDENESQAMTANNVATVKAVREKLRPGNSTDKVTPVFGLFYDFSTGAPAIGMRSGGRPEFRQPIPAEAISKKLEDRYRDIVAYASVQAGWPQELTFITGKDRIDTPILPTIDSPSYAEFWAATEIALLPIGSVNDRLDKIDTPHDVADKTDFKNVSIQGRNALLLTQLGLESPLDSLPPPQLGKPQFGRLQGRTLQFNVRSGIDAQEPVARAYVHYGSNRKDERNHNSSTYLNSRRGIVLISRLNGAYTLPLEVINPRLKFNVYAYHLNRESALFDKVADQGRVGTQRPKPEFKLIDGQDTEKKLILTTVYPLVVFPGPDPVDYKPVGDTRDGQNIRIIDAVINGDPQHYSFINSIVDYPENDIESNIIFMEPGRHVRFMVETKMAFRLLLVGEQTGSLPKGEGYLVGPLPGGRNLSLPLTPQFIARDMQALAENRHLLYKRFGITDQSIAAALERSREKLAAADASWQEKDWRAATGSYREAWGIQEKFYPRILRLAREAVFSVVILMALLVPCAVFLENLLIGAKSILAQLGGTIALFVAGVAFLKYFHPAFQISVSPFIVVIAFTMILMATVVLAICYQRFEVLVRRARIAGGEAESEEISLMSSLSTALTLGVSNLKKRATRTFLTAMTVTVLTFSIIAFVSVKGKDTLFARPVTLDKDVEGVMVEPIAPKYEGVLFRSYFWTELSDTFVSAVRSEFASRNLVTVRGHYIDSEGGTAADREGTNQIAVRHGRKSHILTAIMTFEPAETQFSRLHETVSRQAWFTEADRFTVILPDTAAAALGIKQEMIFDEAGQRRPDNELPEVFMQNIRWKVVGILDTALADRYRDLTGKSLAIVDYSRSAFNRNAAQGELVNEPTSYHMSWKELAIVPASAMADVKAKPRSIAILFNADEDRETFFRDISMRINRPLFGVVNGDLSLITTKTQASVSGLAKIIVPVILCILIVTNTMMGNVEERKGEVAMLGAIGLSPRQISFLLMSESTVFSVIGIICGMFGGLFFANLIPWVASHYGGFLAGLSFNFTTVTSMGLAMATGLVVLFATFVPSRKAAALAAPSGMARWELPDTTADGHIEFPLPFTLTRGNAVGMIAFFRRFLLNHTESTSQDFNCRNVRVHSTANSLAVTADMWLEPYDLDVAQHLEMSIVPTENRGVFGVIITLKRTSGTEEAWLRTNYGFMDLVRHQFLLWRNLAHASRESYIDEGAQLFQRDNTGAGTV